MYTVKMSTTGHPSGTWEREDHTHTGALKMKEMLKHINQQAIRTVKFPKKNTAIAVDLYVGFNQHWRFRGNIDKEIISELKEFQKLNAS